MKNWKVLILLSVVLSVLTGCVSEGETLYNGIVLPEQWPPNYGAISREPMPVPYLKNPPAVVPIDVGRQLFVDDFLIAESTLKRTFHQPDYCKQNPVIEHSKPGEEKSYEVYAAPFSGGACYDPADKLFKMWYTRSRPRATCYATSTDGINWEKPALDVVRSGTNIVLRPRSFNSTAVLMDLAAKNPDEKYKYFASENFHKVGEDLGWSYTYRCSPDGINWSEPKAQAEVWGDRSTAFYNPFRKVWVLSQRTEDYIERRARSYLEGPTILDMMSKVTFNGPVIENDKVVARGLATGESVNWTGANDIDPRHTDPEYADIRPHLYNLDASPYESLMIGQFSVWQGPSNKKCGELGLQKRNDILLGFSRDGFHWDRSNRERFISSTWDDKSWRYGNVQSCATGPIVVGDKLYFYFSGHAKPRPGDDWDKDAATGLAILRRDGFASMSSGNNIETLTTRPVTFKGKHLFVNADCPKGELKVEVLNKDGKVIEPFTLDNCKPISTDKTLVQVKWGRNKDLAKLAGKPVRFRFHLRNGSLYSFWVSPDTSGASGGYIGAGGRGFTGPTDTVGKEAL
ncbi:MAG: glycoside hydrolase family protein [Planctomycetota bacterium]